MGITNNIPPSRLIQPGVIDNAAARPASPFEGQCIFQKDTDQLLVWNGTAWVIPNQTTTNPTGLELITSGSLSGTTTDFVGCFTNTYDNYLIVMDKLFSTANLDIYFQFLNGTTPHTSGYDWAYLGYRSNTTNVNSAIAGHPRGFTGITMESSGARIGSANLNVYGPKLSQRTFLTSHYYGFLNPWGFRVGGSHVDDGSQFDGIRFATNTAATFSGSVRIYGYRNS
jgi:hypothetical protein